MVSNTQKKRLQYEAQVALERQNFIGISKHDIKEDLKRKNEAAKIADPYAQMEHVMGIFSYGTMGQYNKCARNFINFALTLNTDLHHFGELRELVFAYFESMIKKGLSAWTIRTRIFALASAYDCDYREFGIEHLPERHIADIKRNRAPSESLNRLDGKNFELYMNFEHFFRATGIRRDSLFRLGPKDILENADGSMCLNLLEKGGKKRIAPVLSGEENFVRFMLRDAFDGEIRSIDKMPKLCSFPKNILPTAMPVHQNRAFYAQRLMAHYAALGLATGELYRCRKSNYGKVYDKGLLALVSKALGHNRLDVVVNHYMYQVNFCVADLRKSAVA